MITLTQEKREELIAHNTEKLKGLKNAVKQSAFDSVKQRLELEIQSTEITLAALTASAVGSFHIYEQKVDATTDYVRDGEWPIDEGELLVYAAPPVPEINLPHELMDLVNAVEFYHAVKAENPKVETGMWKDAYDWIKKAAVEAAPVIKRLNGLGE